MFTRIVRIPRTLIMTILLTATGIAVVACSAGSDSSGVPVTLATPAPEATPTAEPIVVSAETGLELASQNGCAACHSSTGNSGVGPTWKGLFGEIRSVQGGETVLADENYLRESIVTPNARVVEGFGPNIMPQNFGARLAANEIESIIAYIKTLQ